MQYDQRIGLSQYILTIDLTASARGTDSVAKKPV